MDLILIAPFAFVLFVLFANRNSYPATNLPSLFTSIGIFGTFFGVAISLYFFDVSDIQESVPKLLSGMKVAFYTSVLGIGFSIWVRYENMKKAGYGEELQTEATAEDVCNILSEIKSSISGEKDSTLVSQVKLMRQELKDNHERMVKSFEEFAEKMADNNSKALIEALEEVIRDFNAKINEQFGENFKELNSAVGKLLEWQENYKTHLEESHQALKTTMSGIEVAKSSLSEITEKATIFKETSEHLSQILQGYNKSQEELETKMEGFKSLAEEAKQAFPIIGESVKDITEMFGKASKKTEAMFDMHSQVTKNVEDLFVDVDKAVTHVRESVKESFEGSKSNLKGLCTQVGEDMKLNMKQLDEDLGQELTKVLESLGNQLATLSNQFVKDYGPLTKELKNIVEISKRV
jgi:uncharacterized protein YukE